MKKQQMHNVRRKVVTIIAGGTGGHIFPAISCFHFLKDKFDICIITDSRGNKYFNQIKKNKKNKFDLIVINSMSPYKSGLIQKFKFLLYTLFSILKSLFILIRTRPNLLIGFGGYTTVFPCIIGKIIGIKFIIHEQNAIMGRANKLLERFANISLVSFENTMPETNSRKRIFCGTPVRNEFFEDKNNKLKNNRNKKNLNILIFGGSLGSDFFSEKLPHAFCKIDKNILNKLQITHQIINPKINKVKQKYMSHNVSASVKKFFNNIHEYYKNADLIICRAGGSTLAEIIVSKIPSIIIPFNKALDNHQMINSRLISNNNLGWVINENDFDIKYFNKIIKDLVLKKNILFEKKKKFCSFNKKISKITNNKLPNQILYDSIMKILSFKQTKTTGISR